MSKLKIVDNDKNDGALQLVGQLMQYEPTNEQEEQDLLLAKLIFEREDKIWQLESKLNSAAFSLSKLDLERTVHDELLISCNETEREEWKYNFSEDYYQDIVRRRDEIQSNLAYRKKWLATARDLIKTDKYKSVPAEFFRSYLFDYEEEIFWDDGDILPSREPMEIPF